MFCFDLINIVHTSTQWQHEKHRDNKVGTTEQDKYQIPATSNPDARKLE